MTEVADRVQVVSDLLTVPDETEATTFLVRQIELVYVGEAVPMARLPNSRHASKILRKLLPDGPRESLVALFVNAKHAPIGWYRFSGGMTVVGIPAHDLMRPALIAGAAGIILGHNHPSGDSHPSPEDVDLTDRIVRCSELLGLKVLDHVILGMGAEFFSFKDAGLLS